MRFKMKRLIFLFVVFIYCETAFSEESKLWIIDQSLSNCQQRCETKNAQAAYGRGDRAVCANFVENDLNKGIDRPGYKRDEKGWDHCKVAFGDSVRRVKTFACLCVY